MLKIACLDHIVLRSANVDAMVAFYCEVLACSVERETPPDLGLTQLRAGSALIDLVAVDSELGRLGGPKPGESGNNMDHFCLQLEAISEQDLGDHLARHGVVISGFQERYGAQGFGPSVYIRDPDGNVVELKSRIDAA